MSPITSNLSLAILFGAISLVALYLAFVSLHLSHKIALLKTQLHRARENEQLALYDFLTGLLNRRGWDQAVRSLPPDGTQTLAMLDLDHFKKTNDHYGHRTGDRVLKEFADRLKMGFESSDAILARLGGEEFAIFSAQPAALLFESVELWLEKQWQAPFEDRQNSIAIRCSVGVAQRIEGESIEDWHDRADRALYEAKALGGNCARLAGNLI